jgi:hypothetical protein
LEETVDWKYVEKKTKVVRISRQQSPIQILRMWNMEYLSSMITNDVRCARDIPMTSMEKAAFNSRKALLTSKLDLNVRKILLTFYT